MPLLLQKKIFFGWVDDAAHEGRAKRMFHPSLKTYDAVNHDDESYFHVNQTITDHCKKEF